ncbi:MAG: glycine cleavage system protein GcvH [Gemmataceae bacterium]
MNPKDLKYAKSHEWVRVEGDTCLVGLTRFAVDQLTDITYIELPKAGEKVTSGEGMGEVESVKAVSDIYAPLDGEIVAVNEGLAVDASLVSRDPYGEGWLVRIRPSQTGALDHLMNADEYTKQTEGA